MARLNVLVEMLILQHQTLHYKTIYNGLSKKLHLPLRQTTKTFAKQCPGNIIEINLLSVFDEMLVKMWQT